MHYLTNFYKNKCDNLQEKLNLLESQLQYLQEAPDTSALRSIMGDKAYEQLMRQQERERTKLQQGSDRLVRGAMSVPATATGTIQNPSSLTATKLPSGFHDQPAVDVSEPSPFVLDQMATGLGIADEPYKAPSWEETMKALRGQQTTQTTQASQSVSGWKPSNPEKTPFGTQQPSVYGTPPSPQFAPTTSQVRRPRAKGIEGIPPISPQAVQNRDTTQERAISGAARQALPSAARDVLKPPAPTPAPTPAPQGEDFSEFWKKKGHGQARWHHDKELEEMMFRFKRSGVFSPDIPVEKQPIEYRAARAELIRRGKLKG